MTDTDERAPHPPITAESRVNEVATRFPSTAAVFLQQGPLFDAKPGDVYLSYRGWTVGEFAARHGVDEADLLRQLDAEAEGAMRTRAGRPPGAARRTPRTPAVPRWPRGSARVVIGYTGTYEERPDLDIEARSVVATQSRGPE